MENQRTPSGLEKFLFGFTRILTIGGVLIGMIVLLIAGLKLLPSSENEHVSLNDINTKSISQNNSVAEASAKPEEVVFVTKKVKEYLSGDNEKILQGWLDSISKQEQKQDFLDNLFEVITGAEEENLDVVNVINNYKIIKLAKFNKSEIEKYKEMGGKAAVYMVIFGVIIFISLMSLILVMLAIERNTRDS